MSSLGGAMKFKFIFLILVLAFLAAPVFAQVATRTGSVYGRVLDEKGAPLPGVNITLESDVIPAQTATSGASGGFRFANLPPGTYSVNFSLEGFTEVRQEEVRVNTGSQVQLEITLKPSLSEEFTVIGDTPVVDKNKTGTAETYDRAYLDEVPSGRDPWTIIDQTTGVDSDRYNVAGSESGQQASFIARGGSDDNTIWNYDGVNATDPGAIGASPTYFDFDAFEELQISTGGNNASIPTGGVTVNIVTKRGSNNVEGNASFYFVNQDLQSSNTPQELLDNPNLNPITGAPIKGSNRLNEIKDYGFDLGGPIIKDKLFAWGAYRKNEISLFNIQDLIDATELIDYNFKANMNWSSAHESQFGYFQGNKKKSGRPAFDAATHAPETLWEQSGTDTILPGIWTGQHTWIPSDNAILTGRYGYIGLGFSLVPRGGNDIPMIYLSRVPRWEDTIFFADPIDRPSHDINLDANYFKDDLMGADHEFKFGFEYKTSELHTFSTYGNGNFILDTGQTQAGGPLVGGLLFAQHFLDGRANINRTSFYATDTIRKDRLTLNLGLRFDSQSSENLTASIPAVVGFEDLVGPIDFPGNDLGVDFNNFAPRIGATYDLSGDGKTIVRGNIARYYDTYNPAFAKFVNPTFNYNGALFTYANLNGDRTITRDEITGLLAYYGGLNGANFDLDAYLRNKIVDPDLVNSNSWEYIVGFERQLAADLSFSATFTHRDYRDTTVIIPFGISSADYVPAGNFTANTPIGDFSVPIFTFGPNHDGRTTLTNANDYKTSYNGIDLSMRKRMSNDFMLNAGVTLQRQKAKYDGGDSQAFYIGDGGLSGQTFPFDPGQLPFLDNQPYAFAPLGSGKAGVYPYSEWQLKLSGVYQFPWQISAGAFARYQQGYPYVIFGRFDDPNLAGALGTDRHLILVEPFGSRRFDNIFSMDLQFEKGIELQQYGRLTLAVNVFNVTNTNIVIRRNRALISSNFNKIDENISPRAVRLGVRYSF